MINPMKNPLRTSVTLAPITLLALVVVGLLTTGVAQAQNQTVTMTNNAADVNGGNTFNASNYTNNGTGASTGWTPSSTTGANVLLNLGSA